MPAPLADYIGENLHVAIEDSETISLLDSVDETEIYMSRSTFAALVRFARRSGFYADVE